MELSGEQRRADRGTVLLAHPSPDLYGADRMLLETVDGLVTAGWSVVVTVPGDGPLVPALRARGAQIAICPTVVLRKSFLRGLGPVQLIRTALLCLRPSLALLRSVRPDVVWVNTVTVPMWSLLGRLTRRAVVTHVHEAEDAIPAVLRRALALPLSLAHVVVVNSDATGRSMRSDGVRLVAKIRRIYNGVPGPATPTPVDTSAAPPGDRPRLLFVGRFAERKGPDVLIEMLAGLRERGVDAQLELVGSVFPGYEHYERRLRDDVRRLGLTDRVEFSGFLDPVWDAYARSDIAFVPSRVEPLGNTAVEAMLAGVPLVASRVQGLIEVAADGRDALLVEPGDATALADAVVTMLGDWPATRDRAADAQRNAFARFAVERYRTDVAGVADDVLTRRR